MKTLRDAVLIMACLSVGGITVSGTASAGADIVVDVPPPPVRAEHMPPPRDGYTWAPGHWEWSGHFYQWVSGAWITERRNAHWIPDRWEQVGTQWRYVAGHWER